MLGTPFALDFSLEITNHAACYHRSIRTAANGNRLLSHAFAPNRVYVTRIWGPVRPTSNFAGRMYTVLSDSM